MGKMYIKALWQKNANLLQCSRENLIVWCSQLEFLAQWIRAQLVNSLLRYLIETRRVGSIRWRGEPVPVPTYNI